MQSREDPLAETLVPPAAERPVPLVGQDLGVIAKRAYAYGDENGRRLLVALCNVDQLAASRKAGRPVPSARPECIELAKASR